MHSKQIGKVEVLFIILLVAFTGVLYWLGDELAVNPENILRNSAFTVCTNPRIPDYWGTGASEYIRDWEGKYGTEEDSPIPGTLSLKVISFEDNPAWHVQSFLYGGIRSERRYTFSVYLKADRDALPVRLGLGSWYSNKWTTVKVNRAWQRYSFTERPGTEDNRVTARIALVEAGVLWIAAPKLELGPKATDYSPSRLDESLKPKPSQTLSINVTPTFEPWPTPFNTVVEISYYTNEPTVRVLVQSNLSVPVRVEVTVRDPASGRVENLQPLGDTRVPPQPTRRLLAYNITALPFGRYELTAQAVTEDGKAVGEARDLLVKLPPSQNEVKVNRLNRGFLVNGKPFLVYAQGIHGAKVDWWLDDIKLHGFNTVVATFPAHPTEEALSADEARIRTFLDECQKRGLKVVFWTQPGGDYKAIKEAVIRTINRFKDHPAVLFWYLLDEPEGWWSKEGGKQEGDLVDLYNAAKLADPYRPAQINWYAWTAEKGGYGSLNVTDIGSLDRYPIGKVDDAMKAVADIASLMNEDCRQRNMPTAFWVQMYGYDDAVREPTPEEERCMTYICLIYGMRAIYYFIYKPMYTGLWESMTEFGKELRALELVLGGTDAWELAVGAAEDRLHYSIWESGGKTYLFACNGDGDEINASFDLKQLTGLTVGKASVWFEGRELSLQDGKLADVFKPYQRHVYEIARKP